MQDLNDKVTGGTLTAAEWNEVPSELQNVITDTGQTPSGGDLNQLGKGVATYSSSGDFYSDGGAADAYVLSTTSGKQAPTAYADGMRVRFSAANANTGASTVNVAGLGVKNIKLKNGEDPDGGDISERSEVVYDEANDWFELQASEFSGGAKNAIINGNFNVWQRATSQTTSGYDSDDRWDNQSSGSTKVHSQQAFALGQTDVPNSPEFYSRTVVTSVGGAGNNVHKVQRIEDVITFSGATVTLSFWAKADTSKNIASEFVQSFGTGGTPSPAVTAIGVTTHALTTSWQKFTAVVYIPSLSGKTIGTLGNDSLGLYFWMDAGSTFDSRTNSLGQQSGTFEIAQVQVEKGSFATDFERRSIGEELALCQRFYQLFLIATRDYGTIGDIVYSGVQLSTQMRSLPAVSIISTASSITDNLSAASNGSVRNSQTLLVTGPYASDVLGGADAEL